MGDTPFTDKAWDEIPHNVPAFGIALGMRAACEKMERQRNEVLRALELAMEVIEATGPGSYPEAENQMREAIAKAKGETP